jgi:carotenoid cleavage dioxygenase-like enzyme
LAPARFEADVYVFVVAHNLATMRTELVILDAPSMQEVARIILPFRVASQVHGGWADATDLPM